MNYAVRCVLIERRQPSWSCAFIFNNRSSLPLNWSTAVQHNLRQSFSICKEVISTQQWCKTSAAPSVRPLATDQPTTAQYNLDIFFPSGLITWTSYLLCASAAEPSGICRRRLPPLGVSALQTRARQHPAAAAGNVTHCRNSISYNCGHEIIRMKN